MSTGAVEGEFALQGLGSDEPAHDGEADSADSAGDGRSSCALGPDQAVRDGNHG